jgi:hypothetical protein
MHVGFWWESQKDRDIGRRIILKCFLEKWGGMDWINLSLDRGQWRAVVYTVLGKFLRSRATGGFAKRTALHGVSGIISPFYLYVNTDIYNRYYWSVLVVIVVILSVTLCNAREPAQRSRSA